MLKAARQDCVLYLPQRLLTTCRIKMEAIIVEAKENAAWTNASFTSSLTPRTSGSCISLPASWLAST